MSTYKNLIGKEIKFLTTNPDNDAAEGQIWYNSATGEFKNLTSSEAWSSGGSLVTARKYLAGAGTQAASLAFGGNAPPSGFSNATEEYNGAGWGVGGNLGTARRYLAGAGTQTAGLAFGGGTPGSPPPTRAETEEYNGSTWSEQNDLNTARVGLAGCGIQTAALAFAGHPGSGFTTSTEKYDGTSWTNTGAMSTARRYLAGAGTQTAGLAFGGKTPPNSDATEEFDGSSWTTGGSLNDARGYLAGAGIQTSALAFGGYNNKADTEQYDGTSWSNKSDLGTARESLAGAGASAGASVAFGGNTTAVQSVTEEFTSSVNVITGAAWASIANFPDSRAYSGGGGTPTSTLVFGGYDGPGLGGYVSTGAEFDGSSWTATGDYVIDVVGVAGIGPVSAGLGCGGNQDNASNVTTSAEYNGSSWTSGNSANASGQGAKMSGSQTSASMGNRSGDGDGHEEYDGTNWTSAANTPVSGNAGAMMAGTQTALLMYGGENSPKVRTELWDGSSWTSGNNMNLDRRQGSYGGTQTYAIAGGGDSNPGIFANTELWNGTSWVSSVNMGTARFYQVGGFTNGPGGVTSNIAATGRTPGSTHSNNCEEFTGETSALNIKTITTS